MVTVLDVLNRKGMTIHTIHPDATVFDAVARMAQHDIGALVVVEGETLLGIISERHYARNVVLKGKTSLATPVREIMERRVVCTRLNQTVEQCMALMSERRVNHLPVLEGEKVVGIVSIGDLVKNIIDGQQFTIEQLEQYIHG